MKANSHIQCVADGGPCAIVINLGTSTKHCPSQLPVHALPAPLQQTCVSINDKVECSLVHVSSASVSQNADKVLVSGRGDPSAGPMEVHVRTEEGLFG